MSVNVPHEIAHRLVWLVIGLSTGGLLHDAPALRIAIEIGVAVTIVTLWLVGGVMRKP